MIKIENAETFGWTAAIRGMRNPMNSWEKSDSYFGCTELGIDCDKCTELGCEPQDAYFHLGSNDKDLMKRLRNAGTDHRKFMRMIIVYLDITAPLYWWKEFDTYKVGTVANSCSTMHKIHAKQISVDDFSRDYIWDDGIERPKTRLVGTGENPVYLDDGQILIYTVGILNELRELYLKTKDKRYWYKMIQLLPSSYNQKRTVMLNYEVLANMYASRKNHKLDEWRTFCDWVKTLPHSELIIGEERTLEYADQPGSEEIAAPIFALGC